MNSVPTHLTNLMFFATFLIGTGCLKAMYAAWSVKETALWSRLVATQRLRYRLVIVSCVISAGFGYTLLAYYGWTNYQLGIQEWVSVSIIGWLVGFSMWYALLSPLVALLIALRIYLSPSTMAKRVRGGWVSTYDVRLHNSPKILYGKYVLPSGNVLQGTFLPQGFVDA